ncbi:unnamed protein product [Sympodiomycopsis kandeliae]
MDNNCVFPFLLYIISGNSIRMAADIPSFKLNTGDSIPSVGLGVWMGKQGPVDANNRPVQDAIAHALKAGYRHIDTAALYMDEREVGEAVRASSVPREEIFVTTKLASNDVKNPEAAFEKSLELLDLGYIDLWLLHWPQGQDKSTGDVFGLEGQPGPTFNETWQRMEKIYRENKDKVRNIGVSNFSIKNLEILSKTAVLCPAVNQVEGHPYHPDEELAQYCESKGIHITYYSPLGQALTRTDIIKDEEITAIAKETSSTAGQVALSWAVAKGRSVIPKSAREERIKQNITLVKLSADQIKRIDEIHTKDPHKHTRLNVLAANGKEKTVFGWTLDQLGWDIGYLPVGLPGPKNTVSSVS